MPFIETSAVTAAFTANGATDGGVTVADVAPFYPGARVWLRSDTVDGKEYIISAVDSTKVYVRLIPAAFGGVKYGRTSVAEYLLADNAKICMAEQLVPVDANNAKPRMPR